MSILPLYSPCYLLIFLLAYCLILVKKIVFDKFIHILHFLLL